MVVAIARDLNYIVLNVVFLLVLVDVCVYVCAPEKRKDLNEMSKKWQNKE